MTDGGRHLLDRKALARVAYFHHDAVARQPYVHVDAFGGCMLGRVRQRFLANMEKRHGIGLRQRFQEAKPVLAKEEA